MWDPYLIEVLLSGRNNSGFPQLGLVEGKRNVDAWFLSGLGLWVSQLIFLLCSSPQGLKMGVRMVMILLLSNLTRLSSRACEIVEGNELCEACGLLVTVNAMSQVGWHAFAKKRLSLRLS